MDDDKSASDIGRFQILHFACIVIISASSTLWHTFAIVFQGYTNSHHCRVPENLSLIDVIPVTTGRDGAPRLAQCEMYAFPGNNRTVPCQGGYEYDDEFFPSGEGTIVTEWNLVCDKRNYVEYAVTVQTSGIILGTLICGSLGDRFGRRHVFFWALLLLGVLSMIMAFVSNFIAFCIINCGRGIAVAGVYLSSIVLGTEVLSRGTSANAFVGASYGLCQLIMVLMSYLLRRWRQYQIAVSALTLLSVIYYKWCPESIRWYIARGRIKDARALLRRQAKMNGCSVDERDLDVSVISTSVIYSTDQEKANGTAKGTYPVSLPTYNGTDIRSKLGRQSSAILNGSIKTQEKSLFCYLRKPKILLFIIGLFYQCFLSELNLFGLQLLQAKMKGNIFTINVISGIIGIPGNILGYITMDRFGRRWTLIFCLLMTAAHFGVSTILIIITDLGVWNLETVATWIVVLAKPYTTAHWIAFVVFSQELSPTSVRATLFGLQSGFGFVGTILSPFIAVTAMRLFTWLPLAIFGVLSFFGVFFTLLLPETLGRGLPSSMEDILHYSMNLTKEEKLLAKQKWEKRRLFGFVNLGFSSEENSERKDDNCENKNNIDETHF